MLFMIFYQTSRTCETRQIPDTCPLKPVIGAKIIKKYLYVLFFLTYFIFRLSSFIIRHSSLVIRHSSFPYILSIFFALVFFLFCCLSNRYIFSYLYFYYPVFQYIFNVLSLRQNQVLGDRCQVSGVRHKLLPLNF